MAIKNPNFHKTYQYFQFGYPLKYTQIVVFGMKICHLATLLARVADMAGVAAAPVALVHT
jgi:hypothetical protein